MWSGTDLKLGARNILKSTYLKALLVSVVLIISYTPIAKGITNDSENIIYVLFNLNPVTMSLVFLIFRIFLGYHLEIGSLKFFICSSKNDSRLSYLGHSFRKHKYIKALSTMFLKSFFLVLWSFLIIPGLIKYYSYSFVPYLIADDSDLDATEIITQSRRMADGHKIDMFILDLSFLGWYIVGITTYVISAFYSTSFATLSMVLFIISYINILVIFPYYFQTKAELYTLIKDNYKR